MADKPKGGCLSIIAILVILGGIIAVLSKKEEPPKESQKAEAAKPGVGPELQQFHAKCASLGLVPKGATFDTTHDEAAYFIATFGQPDTKRHMEKALALEYKAANVYALFGVEQEQSNRWKLITLSDNTTENRITPEQAVERLKR